MAQSIELPPPTATMKSMLMLPGEVQAGLDVPGGRVLLDAVEDEDFQPGVAQRGQRPLRMAGRLQAGIGDQQHALAAQFARQFAEPAQRARPEDHARQRLKVERRQRARLLARDAGRRRW